MTERDSHANYEERGGPTVLSMSNTDLNGQTTTQSNRSAYMSIKDVANYLGVSVKTVHCLIKDSRLPSLKINGHRLLRIPKKEFFAWIKQHER